MVDYKQVANIFSDFMGAYTGQKPIAIRELFEKYKENKLFLAMIGALDEAYKIPVTKFLRDLYEELRPYRSRCLSDKEWENVVNIAGRLGETYKNNVWSRYVILEFLSLLEQDDKELRAMETESGNEKAA